MLRKAIAVAKGVVLYTWQLTQKAVVTTVGWEQYPPKHLGGWDLYQWKVPIEDADDGDRITEIEGLIETKTQELNQLREELKPLEATYQRGREVWCLDWTQEVTREQEEELL